MSLSEEQARAALRESVRMNGDPVKGRAMANDDSKVRLPRVGVDMSLPFSWLLGIAGLLLLMAVKLYFSVDSLAVSMDEVKSSLRTSTAMTSQLVSEQTLMKYRIEKLEADRAARK